MAKLDIQPHKCWNMRHTKIVAYEARFGDVYGRGESPQGALDSLAGNIMPCVLWQNAEPTIAIYGGYTLVVWFNLNSWSYRLAGMSCSTSGLKSRQEAIDSGCDHIAQLLMDCKQMSRETVRAIAADKSLFDSLYPATVQV